MNILESLKLRTNTSCELCSGTENLNLYQVEPKQSDDENDHILICNICKNQIDNSDKMDPNHWRCLNDSMWSEIPAVQVMAWRMLNRLKAEGWPQDLLDMMYLDEDILFWAKAGIEETINEEIVIHKDSNGVVLENGDSVVLIKDLKVKGSSMVAKRGTAVRRISLDHENEEYIEGKVDGQHIVIITKYVKKI